MLEYIKMFIISLVSSLFAPLAASSSGHFSFLNSILDFSNNDDQIGFYFSIVSLAFSLTSFYFVRKIYAKGFSAFTKKGASKLKNAKLYKNMILFSLASLIPAAAMFIPVSKEKFLCDVVFDYFIGSNILISAFCSISSGLFLIVALWYSNNKNCKNKNNSKITDVLRLSIYQIPACLFPGFSHVATAATSLTVGRVDERVIMREILIYVAPSTFVVSILRIVRYIVSGLVLDPVLVIICAVGALIGNIVMLNLVCRINIKKTFLFMSLYSIIFGIAICVVAFI